MLLLIHDQHRLVVLPDAFRAELFGGADRARIVGITRPVDLLQAAGEGMFEGSTGSDRAEAAAAILGLGENTQVDSSSDDEIHGGPTGDNGFRVGSIHRDKAKVTGDDVQAPRGCELTGAASQRLAELCALADRNSPFPVRMTSRTSVSRSSLRVR